MPEKWDDEEGSSSGSEDAKPTGGAGALRRNKFEDEEDDDDVLDSWDADDSEVEREKAKKAAEEKAKAEAAKKAAAAKKPKGLRVADKVAERAARQAEAEAEAAALANETEAERRERLRRNEQEADLQHAADLFGDAGLSAGTGSRKSAAALRASAVAVDVKNPAKTVDLGALPLLNPTTKPQFDTLRTTLAPLLVAQAKKPHYALFVQDLVKELCRALPSEQIKKTASSLTALSNDKLREEKAEKGGKKTKAAKTKTSLAVGRPNTIDTGIYDDDAGYGDDDFM